MAAFLIYGQSPKNSTINFNTPPPSAQAPFVACACGLRLKQVWLCRPPVRRPDNGGWDEKNKKEPLALSLQTVYNSVD
ncbi:MAG TPA: hypothetical protein ENN09_06520 [Planctomycetes bacterium]|nr:hypothetical protein [Planctomycetota bacterium]